MMDTYRTVGIFFGPGNAQTLVCPSCYAKLGWPHADTQVEFPRYLAVDNPDAVCSPHVGCGNPLVKDES